MEELLESNFARARRLLATIPVMIISLGRDVYSRVVYGARVSLIVGGAVAVIRAAIGLAIGVVSSYLRWFDAIVTRIMDHLMAVPASLLAIALVSLAAVNMLDDGVRDTLDPRLRQRQ